MCMALLQMLADSLRIWYTARRDTLLVRNKILETYMLWLLQEIVHDSLPCRGPRVHDGIFWAPTQIIFMVPKAVPWSHAHATPAPIDEWRTSNWVALVGRLNYLFGTREIERLWTWSHAHAINWWMRTRTTKVGDRHDRDDLETRSP